MSRLFVLTLALMAGVCGGAASSQIYSVYLGERTHAGIDAPTGIGGQFQAIGKEGGIAIVTLDPAGEGYFVAVQPRFAGDAPQKRFSLSILNARSGDGSANVRMNAAYVDWAGKQRDNIQQIWCGGHGTVINPVDPWGWDCPGLNRTRINGTVEIRGAIVLNGRPIW